MGRKRKAENLDGNKNKISIMSKEQLFSLVEDGNLRGFKKNLKYADVLNDRDELGNTYLHRTVIQCSNAQEYTKRKAMLKYLLSEAPKLTIVKNHEGDTVLGIVCKNTIHDDLVQVLHSTGMQVSENVNDTDLYREIWLSLIKYTLVRLDPSRKTLENVPLNIIQTIFNRRIWPAFKNDLAFLFQGTVDTLMQEQIIHSEDILSVNSLTFKPLHYEAVSFGFKSFIMVGEYEVDEESEFVAEILMEYVGKENSMPFNDCVSPLTILMCKPATMSSNKIFQLLIKSGINVESQALQVQEIEYPGLIDREENVQNNAKEKAQYYNNIKNQLKLPDALLIAFFTRKCELVEILLSHWWAPPIALLFFNLRLSIEDFNFWFPKLIKYGGIIHGRLSQQLMFRIFTMDITGLDKWIQLYLQNLSEYNAILRSPRSLREIAKYAVRKSLAERASEFGTSLPSLLEQVIDPPLHHLVKH